jgi:hypothetical protein
MNMASDAGVRVSSGCSGDFRNGIWIARDDPVAFPELAVDAIPKGEAAHHVLVKTNPNRMIDHHAKGRWKLSCLWRLVYRRT